MQIEEKPDLDDALLEHYGMKGMKWGVRRGKSTTGVSRARGGIIDANDRMIARKQNAMKGKGLLRDRAAMALDRAIFGKDNVKNYQHYTLKNLKQQNARMKSGKVTVNDRLQVVLRTTPLDLVLSNRPK